MAEQQAELPGPDLTQGVALADLADGGMLVGHVGQEKVLMARQGSEVFAVGAECESDAMKGNCRMALACLQRFVSLFGHKVAPASLR